MIRLKRQTTGSYTFESLYYDDDGVHVNVTTPVSIVIKDGAGATVYTGTPTIHSGHCDITLPVATLPNLDTYEFIYTAKTQPGGADVRWTDIIELVGGHLFEIADLRAQDRAFLDTAKYPTETLRQVRIWVEDVIEGPIAARLAFVPRGRRVVLDGNMPDLSRAYSPVLYNNDYRNLIAPDFAIRKVNSGSINGVALTQDEIDNINVQDNVLWRNSGQYWPAWSFGVGNIKLHYEFGLDRAPGAITRAALILAREYLVKSDLPARATATSIGDQMFRVTIAGRDGITGIPDVDAAIAQFGRTSVAIG